MHPDLFHRKLNPLCLVSSKLKFFQHGSTDLKGTARNMKRLEWLNEKKYLTMCLLVRVLF